MLKYLVKRGLARSAPPRSMAPRMSQKEDPFIANILKENKDATVIEDEAELLEFLKKEGVPLDLQDPYIEEKHERKLTKKEEGILRGQIEKREKKDKD